MGDDVAATLPPPTRTIPTHRLTQPKDLATCKNKIFSNRWDATLSGVSYQPFRKNGMRDVCNTVDISMNFHPLSSPFVHFHPLWSTKNYLPTYLVSPREHPEGAILETCDLSDIWSEWWGDCIFQAVFFQTLFSKLGTRWNSKVVFLKPPTPKTRKSRQNWFCNKTA